MAEDNKIIAELIVEGVDQFKAKLAESASGASKFRTEIDKTTDSLKKLEEENKTNTKEYEKLKAKLSELNVEYDKLTKTNVNYKKELKLTKQEIITLTLELNKMKDAGKQGSVEFKVLEGKIKALTDSAGNLHDAISDVSGTVKNAGSDTRGLDRTLRVVTSVSAGFQLAQGSVALFGSENKELTNALIKLNGIMAVTNALQQIQDELLKEDSVLTGIATVGKRAYAGAVAFATGAMSLFRTALVSLGIGAFIAGIALLVENWDRLKLAIAGATGSLQRLADQREKDAQLAKDNIKNLDTELKYKIAIGELDEKSALSEKIKEETEARKAILENYKAQKKILNELETQKFAKVFGVEIGEKSTRKELEAQRKKVKEVDLEFMNYTISIDGARKQLTELNKTKIDKPIKEAKQSIKELSDELVEIVFTKVDFKFPDEAIRNAFKDLQTQIDFATEQLVAEFSINPKSDSIESLSAKLRDLTKQSTILKAQFENALNPKPKETLESIVNTANVPELPNNEVDPQRPLTFWERLFGTEKENQTKEQLIQEQIKKAQYIVGQINEIGAGIGDVASKAIAIRANNELSALEDKKKRGLISEKEYEKESAKIKNEAAQKQRKVDIAMAIAKIPMAVLQALSSAPPPANYALAAISGALALAQVAILASTPLPKFKEGGLTNRIFKGSGAVVGKSHEQGGVNAELEGNEYVVKGDAVKKYGVKFFNDVNSLKFNPVLSMPKQALTHHRKDTKMYEHLAVISSYLKQGYKTTGKGNEILREIANRKTANHNV